MHQDLYTVLTAALLVMAETWKRESRSKRAIYALLRANGSILSGLIPLPFSEDDRSRAQDSRNQQ